MLKEVSMKLREIENKIDKAREAFVKPIEEAVSFTENFEYTPGSVFFHDKPVLKSIELSAVNKVTSIFGLDSSSRYTVTPYFFIAVASASAINRFSMFAIDSPDIDETFKTGSTERFLLIVPEFEGLETEIPVLEKFNVIVRNPIGEVYSPLYSRSAILDELRMMHENVVLKKLLESDIRDFYLLIDGPIYYTPPLAYYYADRRIVGNDLLRSYIESWSVIVGERVRLIEKLHSDKNVLPIGVVKRLNRSNMLCRVDPFHVSSARMSDLTYLSIITNRVSTEKGKVLYLGVLKYRPDNLPIRLPDKNVVYIGVPKVSYNIKYVNYVFYRVESIYELNTIDPVLYDSVISGSTLPLSILVADNRVKKTTFMLIKYVASSLEIPLEPTFESTGF